MPCPLGTMRNLRSCIGFMITCDMEYSQCTQSPLCLSLIQIMTITQMTNNYNSNQYCEFVTFTLKLPHMQRG